MIIRNGIFYHIHRNVKEPDTWTEIKHLEVGHKYVFGRIKNRYMTSYDTLSIITTITKTQEKKALTSFFCRKNVSLLLKNIRDPELEDFYLDYSTPEAYKALISEQDRIINWSLLIMREHIFEDVRREKYSNLPSRYKCLFVIPDNIESLKYWQENLNREDINIYKLKLNGQIHYGDQNMLILTSRAPDNIKELADQYWKGTSPPYPKNVECLFTGNAEVLEEIPVESLQ